MSVACYIRVQDESKNRGLAFSLLIALADVAHDNGNGTCPPIDYLSRAVRAPERRIPALIETLVRSGELRWNSPQGYFTILVGLPPPPPPRARSVPTKQTIPHDLRWRVWERDNFTCKHCGTRKDLSADHIVPEARGGPTTFENLQTLCKACNSRKGVR